MSKSSKPYRIPKVAVDAYMREARRMKTTEGGVLGDCMPPQSVLLAAGLDLAVSVMRGDYQKQVIEEHEPRIVRWAFDQLLKYLRDNDGLSCDVQLVESATGQVDIVLTRAEHDIIKLRPL